MITGTEVGLAGVLVGAAGLLVSPVTVGLGERRAARMAHQAWLRERRFETYSAVLEHNALHREWRESHWSPEPDSSPPPNGKAAYARAEAVATAEISELLLMTADAPLTRSLT